MSDPIPTRPPSSPIKTVDRDGYRASFYPGFVGRLAVRTPTGEVSLYRQEETFFLPPGSKKPWASSTLEFAGPDGRRIVLQIEDPHQQIGRIEIHLKDPDAPAVVSQLQPGSAMLVMEEPPPPEYAPSPPPDGGTVLVCEDGVVLCPPICPE